MTITLRSHLCDEYQLYIHCIVSFLVVLETDSDDTTDCSWKILKLLLDLLLTFKCSYHVTYAFQSESTLYSCLNVKELLARNRCEI